MITLDALHAEGLDWLLDSSFLGKLAPADQAALLADATLQDFVVGAVLIEPGRAGRSVDLVVAGQATVSRDDDGAEHVIARVGPGHLLGERALRQGQTTYARVVASSPMRTLRIPGERFREHLRTVAALARYVDDLIVLRDRQTELLSLLLREPVLRSLGRDGLERLLQSGEIVRFSTGERVVEAGDRGGDVFLLVKGRVGVFAPTAGGGRERVATEGPGWLFGHASVLLDVPRTADIEAAEACELLRVSDRAFMDLIARNPPLYRRLYQQLASLDLRAQEARSRSRGPMVVVVWSGHAGIGTTTLAHGVAHALAIERRVLLVDLAGARTAERLGATVADDTVAGVAIQRLASPPGGVPVIWPVDRGDAVALVEGLAALGGSGECLVVSPDDARSPEPGLVAAAESLIHLRWARDTSSTLALSNLGFRIDAVRLEDGHELPLATHRDAVRIPEDRVTGARFWRTGDAAALIDHATPMGRAAHRLVRVLTGRTVGVALGGGGALGFAHLALLQALEEGGVPVDYLAGVSFGAVVGALYAAGGLPLARELLARRGTLRLLSGLSTLSLDPLTLWIRRLTHGRTLGTTEIPFFPVALDVVNGEEVVITRGTLADGVRASSSFPGIFPATRRGVARLVDGGIINNVPASVVWDAGADFIIASNIIPRHPVGRDPVLGRDLGSRLRSATTARLDDLLRSVFLLMSQTGRDRATLADHVFDPDIEGFNLYDFHRGDVIYQRALERARAALPDIKADLEADRAMGLAR
ncbi:MAG: cyclic nucleotide-binding domain-containing protein [Myxococcales bacterium]|nr:cyclic nucleotide-binding domain-containing protein [Myxococcales bacterium]